MIAFKLTRNAFGKLVLTLDSGQVFDPVQPVRAFPIQAPTEGISLVSSDGKELFWIDNIESLGVNEKTLILENLNAREFMPAIEQILSVTSFSTPCTWRVRTDRGETDFVLRGDEDIRRLGKSNSLMIADVHGVHFYIHDQSALDAQSKRILDRFM